NAPYPFSPTYIEQYNHKQAISDIIEINNLSNISKYYYPEIQVYSEDTSFKLVNLTNGGEEFIFNNIDKGESIYINNQMKQIESDKKDFKGNKVYRLSNFNKNWFKLVKGINIIKVVGDVDVIFRCSYPITI
ncbi:phage tail protein, partial [Clostridium botulinum]|nr:phage tail protein [Clostridium botulinum]